MFLKCNFFSDGEILYEVKNIKKKIIHSKTGFKCGKKKVRIAKKKSIKTNDSESELSNSTIRTSSQRRTVNITKIINYLRITI